MKLRLQFSIKDAGKLLRRLMEAWCLLLFGAWAGESSVRMWDGTAAFVPPRLTTWIAYVTLLLVAFIWVFAADLDRRHDA